MNEQFKNSNSIDNTNPIDTEVQVRLMNLVMGEASDFERDQLQLMMEQRPELAAYYRHLEHLHGLLCEVGAGEPSMDNEPANSDEDWHLPADRRERVLSVLAGVHQNLPTMTVLASSTNTIPKSVWSRWATAGVMVAAASVLVWLIVPGVYSVRSPFIGKKMGYMAESTSTAPVVTFQEGRTGEIDSSNAYYLPLNSSGGMVVPQNGENIPNSAVIQRSARIQSAPTMRYAQPGGSPAASTENEIAAYRDKQASGKIGMNRGWMDDGVSKSGKMADSAQTIVGQSKVIDDYAGMGMGMGMGGMGMDGKGVGGMGMGGMGGMGVDSSGSINMQGMGEGGMGGGGAIVMQDGRNRASGKADSSSNLNWAVTDGTVSTDLFSSVPSVNNFDSQVQVGKDAAVPAKPNEQSLGTLQD
ncbi:MAG: hypothetical protein ABL921_35080, partial [Pirellula sp.]